MAYLLPRPTALQVVERGRGRRRPEPDERAEHIDVFGNRVLQLGVHRAHDSLTLLAESEVVVEPGRMPCARRAVGGRGHARAPSCAAAMPWPSGRSPAARRTSASTRHGEALRALAEEAFAPHRPVVDGARDLCHLIHETFEYDPTFTDVSTPLSVVLDARRGVCQDFAHLATGCLRSLGLAARYVSGYIETDPPPGAAALGGADASHAWCSLWVPQQGWVDFDPTNDRFPTHRHVTVAWGRDYGDVAPVRGVVIGPAAEQVLSVEVEVQRVPAAGHRDAAELGADRLGR